jgi:fructose transport system substrate-binding protein
VNEFFIAMQNGAKEAAAKSNVDLTIAAGKADGDEQGQVDAIEEAITLGQKGILITPNGPGVNPAIERARDGGLYVIALDTPPEPADTVDITFATDNFLAGQLIGQWTARTLDGKPAVIAMLDAFNDKVVATDYNRDQGFLDGMGIEIKDPKKMGDEDKTGSYSGGSYSIACQEPGQATEDGALSAMERCLSSRNDINVVYAINEPTAFGAATALENAGLQGKVTVVTIDGGCQAVKTIGEGGFIVATSQQYPLRMASLGVEAIAEIARGGEAPKPSEGLDFVNTGVALVTDRPVTGVDSITTAEASKICWGKAS